MPLSLRNLSKHDSKRKIKSVLFDILSLEDSYLDILKSFKRSNFIKLLTHFQNNKYSLNGIIVVFLFLYLLFLVNFLISANVNTYFLFLVKT